MNSQPAINYNSRLAVNPHLVLRIEDDNCALLFDPDSGKVQMLNDTAVAVWQQLDGQRTLREVIDSLTDIYDGMDQKTDEQVLSLARALAQLGAIGIWETP